MTARPYRAREEVYRSDEAADQAEVSRHALIIPGSDLIPALLMAIFGHMREWWFAVEIV